MSVYEYTPPEGESEARLSVAAESAEVAKRDLIRRAIENAGYCAEDLEKSSTANAEEYLLIAEGLHRATSLIWEAAPDNLPIEIVLPLLVCTDEDTVMDSSNGLACSVYPEDELKVAWSEIGDPEEYHRWDDDDPEKYRLLIKYGCTALAYQVQPGLASAYSDSHTEHVSFGFFNDDMTYVPMATILGDNHPARATGVPQIH
ncbi:MAG TPA: hypothetical protein VL989_02915 [Candidatus Sulfotelmatobacter sp.]|nr:hypothetical protein [Candidatus Sulfotelmatobacter sp.]